MEEKTKAMAMEILILDLDRHGTKQLEAHGNHMEVQQRIKISATFQRWCDERHAAGMPINYPLTTTTWPPTHYLWPPMSS
ncbi:ThiF family protein [Sesbania bispinosa]|nr:ThiF family protein [Sesbania bispinosa]